MEEHKLYNENIEGFKTDTRHGLNPYLRCGYMETLIRIEAEIIALKAEKEANKKYGRKEKEISSQESKSKRLIQTAEDKEI